MKKATTAALWSVFIFPGSGHFYLKKPLPGSVIAAFTLAALTVVVINAVERAMQIVDKILSGEVAPDLNTIAEQVSMQTDPQLLNFAGYALGIIWGFAAIDAYRLGRHVDSLASASTATKPDRKHKH